MASATTLPTAADAASTAITPDAAVPLCVDLDGTLVRTDTLDESLLALARREPWQLWRVPLWLLRGKAAFKRELAARAIPDVECLPYRPELLRHLERERARGRSIVLATAADERIAQAVAAHLGLFCGVLASDGTTNLSGTRKLAALAERFGSFDYAGDSAVDLPVWKGARRAIVVGHTPRLADAVARAVPVAAAFESARPPRARIIRKAIRMHQWVKNLLVFVPALAAHCLAQRAMWLPALFAFIGFNLCASAGYLLNDMIDLEADRRDAKKQYRPLASGALSIRAALVLLPTLLLSGLTIGWLVSPVVAALLLLHFVTTTLYSLSWKRVAVLDVLVLAGLYTLRIFTGAAADHVRVSPWLLGVSMFMFLSLALVKRASELRRLRGQAGAAPGRDYQADDLSIVTVLGGGSGYMTVLILALYIHSPDVTVFYAHPERLWGLCVLLLFWVSRIWLLTSRGHVDADPVAFALRDRSSHVIAVAALCIAYLAS